MELFSLACIRSSSSMSSAARSRSIVSNRDYARGRRVMTSTREVVIEAKSWQFPHACAAATGATGAPPRALQESLAPLFACCTTV